MSKSAQVSLQGIHIGDYVGEGVAHENTLAVKGAISTKVTVSEVSETHYSDDEGETTVTVEKIDIEQELAGLSLEERAAYLDEKLINGCMVSNVNSAANRGYKSMSFKSQKRNGAWRYTSIPKIKFSLQEDEFATKSGKSEGKNVKLVGSASPFNAAGDFRIIADSDAVGISQEYLDTFLETIPQLPSPASTPAVQKINTNK